MLEEPSVFAQNLNYYLSLGTIIGVIIVVLMALYVSYYAFKDTESRIITKLSRHILPLGFLTSLFGTFLTLYYSYGLHYPACDLCWFQRIFLYPQMFIFAYAWYRKDRSVLPYTLILSLLGLAVALYHHLLQMGYDVFKPCSTAPFAVDCAKPSFIEFGFVSFPFMAVVLFGFLSVIAAAALQTKKNN